MDSAHDRYLDALRRREAQRAPKWIRALRARGAERFAAIEWPHNRQEAWRFTDLTPIVEGEFDVDGQTVNLQHADILPWTLDEADAELVFVDGHHATSLSRYPSDATYTSQSLSAAILAQNPTLRKQLDAHIEPSDAFVALNSAFLQDGAFIHIPKNTRAGLVHILNIATGAAKQAWHPRTLILADRGSECRVVETYAGLADAPRLANAVVEAIVDTDASLDYAKVVIESLSAYHLSTMQIVQRDGSRVKSNIITLGGKIARTALNTILDGERAECYLRGLYIADADRLVDNALFVTHARPSSLSRVAYRGILDDAGKAVFTGSVLVARGAQKTDSNQVNNNLLLSDAARLDTKPQLRIFADDVKCTHGATIGQPAAETIYYFKTRGIDEPTARRMLTCGFAAEIVGHLGVQLLKDRLTRALVARFSAEKMEA